MDDIVTQAERSRRSLQQTIDKTKQAIEQTMALIARTRGRDREPDAADAPADSKPSGGDPDARRGVA